MSEIESWKTILILLAFAFFIGSCYIKKTSYDITNSVMMTIMLTAYILFSIGIILTFYSLFYFNTLTFTNLRHFQLNNHPLIEFKVFDNGKICIDLLSLLVIIITLSIFSISVLISQLSLHYLVWQLKKNSSQEQTTRILSKYSWLKNVELLVVDLKEPNAFSFTLLRIGFLKVKLEDWIVISSGIVTLLNHDELESAIAHEYSHIIRRDTRFSHIIFTMTTLLFFDLILKLLKSHISAQYEFKADMGSVSLVKKPKALASALFKLGILENSQSKQFPISGFLTHRKSILLERIKRLLNFARINNFTV